MTVIQGGPCPKKEYCVKCGKDTIYYIDNNSKRKCEECYYNGRNRG